MYSDYCSRYVELGLSLLCSSCTPLYDKTSSVFGGLTWLYWNYIIESFRESLVTTTRAVQKNLVLNKGSRLCDV